MGVSSGDGEKCAQAAIDKVFGGQATSTGPVAGSLQDREAGHGPVVYGLLVSEA